MSKQIIEDLFNGKKVDRVPVSFWYHFCLQSDFPKGVNNPAMFKNTVDKHVEYSEYLDLDLLKVMPDGYFTMPSVANKDTTYIDAWKEIEPCDPHAPFFDEQIEVVKQIKARVGDKAAVFYTVFSPLALISYAQFQYGRRPIPDERLAELFEEDPETVDRALKIVTKDVVQFAERLLTEGNADGIFFAVRNYRGISKETYRKYVAPGEKEVLDHIAAIKDFTLLHICGAFGRRNDFSIYEDYKAKAVNWATHVESLSLGKGKEIFKDKVVVGGFDSSEDSILIHGTKEEIQAETRRLLAEAGTDRVIIGADCALPTETVIPEKLKWVCEAVNEGIE